MMGRQVYGKPAPGLYIINGRKIIVKENITDTYEKTYM